MKTKNKTIKVEITLDDNNGSILFKSNRKIIMWDDLTRQQQINICSSFLNFEKLFNKFIKE